MHYGSENNPKCSDDKERVKGFHGLVFIKVGQTKLIKII